MNRLVYICLFVLFLAYPQDTRGQAGRLRIARELGESLLRKSTSGVTKNADDIAELLMRKSAAKAAGISDDLAERLAPLAASHGNQLNEVTKKIGTGVFSILDDAGEHAPHALRMLSQHGDRAISLASRPEALKLVSRHGDEVAEALIKHPGVAETVIAKLGKSAAEAVQALEPRSARRLALMHSGGDLDRMGQTEAILALIGRGGDRAMNFIWEHKGSLTVATTLTAFLADPEPFIDGSKDITIAALDNSAQAAGEFTQAVLAPVAEATAESLGESIATVATLAVASTSGFLLMLMIRQVTAWMARRRNRNVPV